MPFPDTIDTEADVEAGRTILVGLEPKFLAIPGPLPLRRRPDGFAALMHAIVGQQVSTASAAAIWARVQAAGMDDALVVLRASDDDLRGCGLSRPKVRYVRALAEAGLNYPALHAMGTDEVVRTLVAVPGIGNGPPRSMRNSRSATRMCSQPGIWRCRRGRSCCSVWTTAQRKVPCGTWRGAWSPVRAIAARALWAYYRTMTKREGAL